MYSHQIMIYVLLTSNMSKYNFQDMTKTYSSSIRIIIKQQLLLYVLYVILIIFTVKNLLHYKTRY
jgi:hypothetical protein